MAEEEKKQKVKLIKNTSPQVEKTEAPKKRKVIVVKKKSDDTKLSRVATPKAEAPKAPSAPIAKAPERAVAASQSDAPERVKKDEGEGVRPVAASAIEKPVASPAQEQKSERGAAAVAQEKPRLSEEKAVPAPEAPVAERPKLEKTTEETAAPTPSAKPAAAATPVASETAPRSAQNDEKKTEEAQNPAIGPSGSPIPERSGLDPTRAPGRMVNISWVQRNIENTTSRMNGNGKGKSGSQGGGRGHHRQGGGQQGSPRGVRGKFVNGRPVREGGSQGGGQQGGHRGGGQRGGGRPSHGGGSAPAAADLFPSRGSSRGRGRGRSTKNDQKAWQQKDRDRENFDKLNYTKKQEVSLAAVPESIDILEAISIAELAKKMNLKASEIIKKLMTMGEPVSNQNQQIDAETATLVADEFGCQVKIVSLYDETVIASDESGDENLVERAPIVTVMGHVDHGKTKLLDAIRNKDVAGGEFGGITQHIGAYKVHVGDNSIVFLDTPGHAAFTHMRSRGAQVTDVVVLVVAANDGVMPQTIEAINHAKAAEVPIVVAVNKIDLPEANPDKIKQQLSEYELIPEEWGGETIYCEISALKNQGIDQLLESILIQTEVMELTENATCRAEGTVLEAKLDPGRGNVADVIVQRGVLRVGDPFVAGVYSGRVRAIFNDHGEKLEEAGPSTPVEVNGLSGLPAAGSPFQVTETEKEARQVGAKRQELERYSTMKGNQVSLDNLFDTIQQGSIQSLKVIIKSDVQGSAEALKHALQDLSTDEIKLVVIHANAGAIVESDVSLASASEAIIVAFNVRPTPRALDLAETEKVEIRKYNVIYDAVDDIRDAMEGMLAPEIREEEVGTVEVRETFKVPKIGIIAGCYVTKGKVKRKSTVHVVREGIVIYEGIVTSLRRFKDDAKEVVEGFECGVGLEGFQGLQAGDILEVFEKIEIKKKL